MINLQPILIENITEIIDLRLFSGIRKMKVSDTLPLWLLRRPEGRPRAPLKVGSPVGPGPGDVDGDGGGSRGVRALIEIIIRVISYTHMMTS